MISTRKIKKILALPFKTKQKPDTGNNARHYYSSKITQYHNLGIINPTEILIKLIEDGIPTLDTSNKKTFDFLLSKLRDENDGKTEHNFIPSLIALLNRYHDHIIDENIPPLLSSFFSMYAIFQIHLSGPVKKILVLENTFDQYIKNEMSTLFNKHTQSKNDGFQGDNNRQRKSAALIIEHAEKGLLTEVDSDFIKKLISHTTANNNSIHFNAALLVSMPEKIPPELLNKVSDHIMTLIKKSNIHFIALTCTLIVSYFSLMDSDKQTKIIEYLNTIILGQIRSDGYDIGHYKNVALKCLNKLILRVNNRDQTNLIDTLVIVLNKGLCSYSVKKQKDVFFPAKILLRLRPISSKEDNARISSLIEDFILNKNDKLIKRITSEWKYLTENEKMLVIKKVIALLENKNDKKIILALKIFSHMKDLTQPEEQKDTLFFFLYRSLKNRNSKVNSEAFKTLSHLYDCIPKNWRAKFQTRLAILFNQNMSYVTTIYKQNHSTYANTYNLSNQIKNEKVTLAPTLDNFGFDLFILAQLSLAVPEKASSLAKQILTDFNLFEEMTLDLIGYRKKLQNWAQKSIVLLHEYIPHDHYDALAKRLIKKARKDSNRLSIFILSDLIKSMPHQLKIDTVVELAKIVLQNDENTLGLIIPYVEHLSYEYKIYMLNHLMNTPKKDIAFEKLFAALVASCRKDAIKHDLQHIRVNEHILPNEVIENIIRFV